MKKMLAQKKYFSLILIGLCQTPMAAPLTLQDALQSAFTSGDQAKNIREEYEVGQGQIDEYVGFTLPQVTLNAGTISSYSAIAPQMNNQRLNNAFVSSGTSSAQAPAISMPNHLWTQQYNWNLQAFQTLNVMRINVVRDLAKNQKHLVDLQKQNSEDQLSLRVVDSYTSAINAQKNLELQQQIYKANIELLRYSEIEFKRGTLPEIALNQLKAQTELSASQVKQAEVLMNAQKRNLTDLIGANSDIEFPQEEQNLDFLKMSETVSSSQNSQIKLLKEQNEFALNTVKYEKTNYYPSINMIGSINNSFVAMDLSEIKKDGKPIGSDYRFSDSKYYFDADWINYSIGIQLEWKLFDGFMTGARVSQAHAKSEISRRQLTIQNRDTQSKIEQTQELIVVAQNVYLTSKKAQETSKKVYEKDQADFKSGRIRLADLLQSESNFTASYQRTTEAYNRYLSSLVQLRILGGAPIQGEKR